MRAIGVTQSTVLPLTIGSGGPFDIGSFDPDFNYRGSGQSFIREASAQIPGRAHGKNLLKASKRISESAGWDLSSGRKIGSIKNRRDLALIREVAGIIEANLENPDFKLKDLTRSFPLEERQLRSKIKLITGLCPKRFQQEIALSKAKRMLENREERSIKAVAYSVGMYHVTRFSNLFKSRFGMHPSTYF